MNIATQNLLLETKLPRIRTVPTPSSELRQKFQYLNIYMTKKRAKETLHIIYMYSYQESKNSMQNIYCRIYNVQNIPPNKKSLHIPQKSKITICNNIMCLEVAFYRINTKQHLNPNSIQSSRCYITNYCIYDKTTISILKSALY